MGAKWGGRALKYGLPGLGYLGLLSMLTRGGGGEERVSPEERRTQEYPAMALQGQIGREDGEMMRLMEELERATQMAGHMGGGMRGGGFPVTGASLNLMDFVNHRLPELEMIAAQNRNTPTFSQLMGTSGGGAF